MRSVLHFVNDKYTSGAFASLWSQVENGWSTWRSSWQGAGPQHALLELNEWVLRNNEYPMLPFSDSHSDNRSFSLLTFGQLPQAQMPINPVNRGSASSHLNSYPPPHPKKKQVHCWGTLPIPPSPPFVNKYIHILILSNLTGFLYVRKRCRCCLFTIHGYAVRVGTQNVSVGGEGWLRLHTIYVSC
jgi:hypothetical protein